MWQFYDIILFELNTAKGYISENEFLIEMVQNHEEIPVLIGFEGEMDGQRWMLQLPLILGREPNCDISIPNRQVSRRHAKIIPSEDGVILEDLRSKNGTHRNGKPISGPVLLADGDVIHIALAQKFVYLSADATLPLDPENFSNLTPPTMGRLRLEKLSHRVWIDDREVTPPLSVSQFRLLEVLYDNRGKLVPRDQVMMAVWGIQEAIGITEQALDALVRRLRDRLATIDPNYMYVVTVRGHGLRLDNPPS